MAYISHLCNKCNANSEEKVWDQRERSQKLHGEEFKRVLILVEYKNLLSGNVCLKFLSLIKKFLAKE